MASIVPDMDWTPLATLGQTYQKAKQQAALEQGLTQMGLPANMNLAQLALQQQAVQRGEARDTRDFALRERLASPEHAAATQRATLGVQNEFAPKTVDIKLPGGDTVTAQKGPGGYVLPTIQGMPTADPNGPQPPPGVDAKAWRENRSKQLSNIDDKAILEADKNVQAGELVTKNLTRALELSKTAYTGPTAKLRGYAGSLAGFQGGEDTELLSSVVTNQALDNLRATFGGNPTEGERKILLDVQGAVNQAPRVREEIYKNALEAVQVRTSFNKKLAEEMRSGKYLLPASQRNAPAQQAAPQAAGQIAEGATATNPQTGQKIVHRGGQWVPAQ